MMERQPKFTRVRMVDDEYPGTYGQEGVTLDEGDDAPWVRFDRPIAGAVTTPDSLHMPDGRPINLTQDRGHCRPCKISRLEVVEPQFGFVAVDHEIEGTRPTVVIHDEIAEAWEPCVGDRVRRTNNGDDSFEGMTGTITSVIGDNMWIEFDKPTMYRHVPAGGDPEKEWRYDCVHRDNLEPIG